MVYDLHVIESKEQKTLIFAGLFKWRDPDSNRGHHDFQSGKAGPSLYCPVRESGLFMGFRAVLLGGLSSKTALCWPGCSTVAVSLVDADLQGVGARARSLWRNSGGVTTSTPKGKAASSKCRSQVTMKSAPAS